GSDVNKCQAAIGKAATKFLVNKSKAEENCRQAQIKGNNSNTCAKVPSAIAKAEKKKRDAICKACGGPDKAGGGGDDPTPGEIGFAWACPGVTQPGGPSCGGPIADLEDIVDCVDCVTEFKVDCVDRLSVPQLEPYPPECNPTVSTTTTTEASTTTVTT